MDAASGGALVHLFAAPSTRRFSPRVIIGRTTERQDPSHNRMAQQITRLHAVDSEGRAYIILAITPVETVPTYHGVRKEYGQVRHELNDGTAVVRMPDGRFRVDPAGTILEVVQSRGEPPGVSRNASS